MERMENRLPVGPGSRGGRYHDPVFRRLYHRKWRAAHPEYRERERLRRGRERANLCNPADYSGLPTRPLPTPAQFCGCECSCRESVVMICGFCREGMCE